MIAPFVVSAELFAASDAYRCAIELDRGINVLMEETKFIVKRIDATLIE